MIVKEFNGKRYLSTSFDGSSIEEILGITSDPEIGECMKCRMFQSMCTSFNCFSDYYLSFFSLVLVIKCQMLTGVEDIQNITHNIRKKKPFHIQVIKPAGFDLQISNM